MPQTHLMLWEVATGCNKVSPACLNCHAETGAKKLQQLGMFRYRNGFDLTIHPRELEKTSFLEKEVCGVLVASTSDLFNEDIPNEFILEVFKIIDYFKSRHAFRIQTKRSERLMMLSHNLPGINNWGVSLGITCETTDYYYRIEHLQRAKGSYKFLSLAPLLSAMPDLPLEGINHIVVSREVAEKPRVTRQEWIDDVRRQCQAAGVAFSDLTHNKNYEENFRIFYRKAMVYQLIQKTGGLVGFLTCREHSHFKEFSRLWKKYRGVPFHKIAARVRQVAPEFFEP
jgi:protein gp37